MNRQETATAQHEPGRNAEEGKADVRAMWALGSYHQFAKQTVWELGPVLVEACGIAAGQRVLDVAAGTGNVAIRAAEAGARVVASDLTPEHFAAGREEAARHGVELEWVEADAEALPFDDAEFDVVTSCFGALFAPDQSAVADEMQRVCRPGGTIGVVSFRPEATAAAFFDVLGRHAPPPPSGGRSPLRWGDEEQIRELFGDRVEWRELARRHYLERADSPRAYVELFTTTFGPVIALREALREQADRLAAFDRDLLDFANQHQQPSADARVEYRYDYLLALARAGAR